jgi:hypothetical protein
MTANPVKEEKPIEEIKIEKKKEAKPPKEYKHDAAKAPVIEEEEYNFTIDIPDE